MAECKQLARDVKKERPGRQCFPAQIHQSFPRRQVIDELIQLYFTTFESCYRILHFPSFQAEYQSYIEQPENANGPFALLHILLMSVAGVLHGDPNVCREIAAKTPTWIHISQTWLSAPLEKDRLTLKGIEIHCLLLLARQVNRIGADLIWISTGSLLRMAMQMGLHQDPSSLAHMDLRQIEVRRRLWYAILEMNAQAALDSGMSPMITDRDYSTQPPSDLSDADLEEDEEQKEHWEKTAAHSIRASFQCLLAHSIPLRLDAARVINSLQEEPPYDQVLALGNKLSDACSHAAVVIGRSAPMNIPESTNQFAWSFCTHLLRRFLLCLHFTYAVKAKRTPIYAHSHKVCLEIGLEFVSLLDDPLYSRVLINGGGMFRDIITRGVLMVYLELNSVLETGISVFARQRNRARQMSLLSDVHRVLQYSKDRMWHGETNVKGYFFLSIATAQAEALLHGLPTDNAISNAAHESLTTCREMLKTMELDSSRNAGHLSRELGTYNDMISPPMASDSSFDFLDKEGFGFDGLDFDFFSGVD